MKKQHTQGEWKHLNEHDKSTIDGNKDWIVSSNGIYVAQIFSTLDKLNADAKLIAAAPDLLEVLEEIFDQINLADSGLALYKKAEQAIKKATE